MTNKESIRILLAQTKLANDALINAANKSGMFGNSQIEFLEISAKKLLVRYKKELKKVG